MSVEFRKLTKATLSMKNKFQEVRKCIREADNTTVIFQYKLDPKVDKDG